MAPLVPHRRRLWLYLWAGMALLFLILPILIVIPMSFSGSRYLDFPPQTWSLRWYEAYFSNPVWRDATWTTLKVALLSSLLAAPVGTAFAYAVHVSEWPLLRRLRTLLLLPLMVPHIILAIGIFYIYARLGINATLPGLVLAHAMLNFPFVAITTLSGLKTFDMSQELVARSLGFSRLQAFLRVTLPQIRGSVLSGALFAFVMSVDEVIVSLFISAGTNSTLTKVMFVALRDEIDPTIAAISSLLIATSLTIGFAASLLGRERASA
jgi:putative spermidine/putrescine transport system permease protein